MPAKNRDWGLVDNNLHSSTDEQGVRQPVIWSLLKRKWIIRVNIVRAVTLTWYMDSIIQNQSMGMETTEKVEIIACIAQRPEKSGSNISLSVMNVINRLTDDNKHRPLGEQEQVGRQEVTSCSSRLRWATALLDQQTIVIVGT